MKIETHLHTKEGSADGRVNIKDSIEMLINKGYDGMIVTDHNSYDGYDSLNETYDNFVIIKGIEYDTSDAGHMLIILPTNTETDLFTNKGMNIKDTIKIVHSLGGIIGPAHPFDYYKLGMLNNAKWFKNFSIIRKFDFVETFNACGSLLGNHKANLVAKKFNKPAFGGSDTHKKESVGKASTTLPKYVNNEDELINLVQSLKFGDTQVNGEIYLGTAKERFGILYDIGIRVFYGVSFLVNMYTKKKALDKAFYMNLI